MEETNVGVNVDRKLIKELYTYWTAVEMCRRRMPGVGN